MAGLLNIPKSSESHSFLFRKMIVLSSLGHGFCSSKIRFQFAHNRFLGVVYIPGRAFEVRILH